MDIPYDPALIKENCGACGSFIEKDPERYERSGNFCERCITKVNMNYIRRLNQKMKERISRMNGEPYIAPQYASLLEELFK